MVKASTTNVSHNVVLRQFAEVQVYTLAKDFTLEPILKRLEIQRRRHAVFT